MRYRAAVPALVAAMFCGLLAIGSLTRSLPRFFDPCVQWGVTQPVTLSLPPGGPCRAITATSETRVQAMVRLIVVNGVLLLAGILGLAGTLLVKPRLPLLAAGLMLLFSVLLIFSFAWVTVLASGLLLLAARESGRFRPGTLTGARLIGSLAAVGALFCLPGMLPAAPPFLVLLVAALAFVAVVGWWPPREPRPIA